MFSDLGLRVQGSVLVPRASVQIKGCDENSRALARMVLTSVNPREAGRKLSRRRPQGCSGKAAYAKPPNPLPFHAHPLGSQIAPLNCAVVIGVDPCRKLLRRGRAFLLRVSYEKKIALHGWGATTWLLDWWTGGEG